MLDEIFRKLVHDHTECENRSVLRSDSETFSILGPHDVIVVKTLLNRLQNAPSFMMKRLAKEEVSRDNQPCSPFSSLAVDSCLPIFDSHKEANVDHTVVEHLLGRDVVVSKSKFDCG
jgi:hypothetical protein